MKKDDIKKEINEVKRLIKEMVDGLPSNTSTPEFDFSKTNIGDTIEIKTNTVNLVIKKIGENIFEVVDQADSIKLKKGDLLRVKDSKTVNVNDQIEFDVLRSINIDYKTDPIKMIG